MDLFRWTFDPWVGIRQLRSEMEDAFGRFNQAVGIQRATPPLNVFEDEQGITVTAEVPGVKSSDVGIEAEGDTLRLSYKRQMPDGIKAEQYHRQERPVGEFTRELKLPAGLDTEKVEASLVDGVLTVKLPKAEASKPRKIAIKA